MKNKRRSTGPITMEEIDYNKVLRNLISHENETSFATFDEKLQQILQKVPDSLSEDVIDEISVADLRENNSVRWRYIYTIEYVLKQLLFWEMPKSETFLSVMEMRNVKIAIEILVSMGLVPNLLPGVGVGMDKLCPNAAKVIPKEALTDLQKYEQLKFVTGSLMEFFQGSNSKVVVLPQLPSLLAALLQLSHVPLTEPVEKGSSKGGSGSLGFQMTPNLYRKLRREQEQFKTQLTLLLEESPQVEVLRELMVLFGAKETPKWLRRYLRKYLTERILQPNGIYSLVVAICDEVFDPGVHWQKLDVVSKVISVPDPRMDADEYYGKIASQLKILLESKNFNFRAIARSCISQIQERDPKICHEKILRIIFAPLLSISSKNKSQNEREVTASIESLSNLFDSGLESQKISLKFPDLVLSVFDLYRKSTKSVSSLKKAIRTLALRLLNDNPNLISIILKLEDNVDILYPRSYDFELGPTGNFVLSETESNWKYSEVLEHLHELVSGDKDLSVALFNSLLVSLPQKPSSEVSEDEMLERRAKKAATPRNNSYMPRPFRRFHEFNEGVGFDSLLNEMSTINVLSELAKNSTVRVAIVNKPEVFLGFVRSLFDKDMNVEDDAKDLYPILPILRVLLENNEVTDWKPFDDLTIFLEDVIKKKSLERFPSVVKTIRDFNSFVKNRKRKQRQETKNFDDLSVDGRSLSEFEKALEDLAHPLLPVRAHGLITLTKLVDSKDPAIVNRSEMILHLFQENLKHEDSFIYLAAINGLCALATTLPEKVVPLLVEEFIAMPDRALHDEIAPETRAKFGEILVKTTRALGETAPAYKGILVNAFLCATRDPDPMVRASSLSCLGELCKVLGFRLGNMTVEVLYCVGCIIKTDKSAECRRAAVMVTTLLLRGLGKDLLTSIGGDLVELYRILKDLRDNDEDEVLRVHAQLGLEEIDDVVRNVLFAKPKLEKRIFLLQ